MGFVYFRSYVLGEELPGWLWALSIEDRFRASTSQGSQQRIEATSLLNIDADVSSNRKEIRLRGFTPRLARILVEALVKLSE
jgi:hypothetical protein